MASRLRAPLKYAKQRFENEVYGVLAKYGYPPFGKSSQYRKADVEPPYERQVSPDWLQNIAQNHGLVNNSVESKVHQTFRRGFTGWEKKWEAKCPVCGETFQSLDEFKLDEGLDEVDISEKDVDLDTPRPCPADECESEGAVELITPDPDTRDRADSFFERANLRDRDEALAPDTHASISQTFHEVCEEVARDIQVFDDGWMVFERSYVLESDGSVWDWKLEDVHRAPAHLMRYSVDEDDGKIGNEYWICLECRAKNPEDYDPDTKPGPCSDCEARTYEVFAYQLDDVHGDPINYFVRGEFAHGSEYHPSFLYGYSPILSVWQEVRTLEQMDSWYQEAYEKRRAPRGAIVVSSSNASSVRAWNTEQMEKLNSDVNHIPTFIDDTDNGGEPIKYQPLLEEPAEMQHMQMREWYLDRISSKFGVTQVFQTASADSTGMSQSLEIVVANRSMERLKRVFDEVFLPALLGQCEADGWTRRVSPPEPEDEQARAQLVGRHLNNAQVAQQLGLEAEWTEDSDLDVKAGRIEPMEQGEEEGAEGGLGGIFGGNSEEASQPAESGPGGTTTPSGGRPGEPNEMGGRPDEPANPTTDEPYRRANNAVTSDSGGYSNPRHGNGGQDEDEVIDYLESVQDQLADPDDSTPQKAELVQRAIECYSGVEAGPDIERLEDAAQRPDTTFQTVRQHHDGDWTQTYEKNEIVRRMFDILQLNGHVPAQ